MFVPLRDFGKYGLIYDTVGETLPVGTWTDGRNIRFSGSEMEKMLEPTQEVAFDEETNGPIAWIQTWSTNLTSYLVAATATNLWFWRADTPDTGTWIEVGGPYDPDGYWQSFAWGDTCIFNNGRDKPQIFDKATLQFIDLPNWGLVSTAQDLTLNALPSRDTNAACKVLLPYRNFLVALGISEDGGYSPNTVWWSDSTTLSGFDSTDGGGPPSWDYESPATLSNKSEVGIGSGPLQWGCALNESLILYTDTTATAMTFTGGSFVMSFRRLFNKGAAGLNTAVEFNNQNFVISRDQIYLHDGSTVTLIAKDRIEDEFFRRAGKGGRYGTRNVDFDTLQVVKNPDRKEIYVLFADTVYNPYNIDYPPGVNPPPGTCVPVEITTQPTSLNGVAGDVLTFSVEVNEDATQPVLYQWFKQGEKVMGATSSSVSHIVVGVETDVEYTVHVENECGEEISLCAKVNDTCDGNNPGTSPECLPYACDAFGAAIEADPDVRAHWPLNDPYTRPVPINPFLETTGATGLDLLASNIGVDWSGSVSSTLSEGVTHRFDECQPDGNWVYTDWSDGAFPPERDFYFSRTDQEAIDWLKANQDLKGGLVTHVSGTPQGAVSGRLFNLNYKMRYQSTFNGLFYFPTTNIYCKIDYLTDSSVSVFIRAQLGDGVGHDSTVVVSGLTWPHHFTWSLSHRGMDTILNPDEAVDPTFNRPLQTAQVSVFVNGQAAGSVDGTYDWAGTNTKNVEFNYSQWDSRASFYMGSKRLGAMSNMYLGTAAFDADALEIARQRNLESYSRPAYCLTNGCEPYNCAALETAVQEITGGSGSYWPMKYVPFTETEWPEASGGTPLTVVTGTFNDEDALLLSNCDPLPYQHWKSNFGQVDVRGPTTVSRSFSKGIVVATRPTVVGAGLNQRVLSLELDMGGLRDAVTVSLTPIDENDSTAGVTVEVVAASSFTGTAASTNFIYDWSQPMLVNLDVEIPAGSTGITATVTLNAGQDSVTVTGPAHPGGDEPLLTGTRNYWVGHRVTGGQSPGMDLYGGYYNSAPLTLPDQEDIWLAVQRNQTNYELPPECG